MKTQRSTFLEQVASFAREAAVWKPGTYKSGKNKGQPCMRDQRGNVRAMSDDEKWQHRPDLTFDLSKASENRVLADLYQDRGHEGDEVRALEHRNRARRMDVHDALVDAVRHLTLVAPVQRHTVKLEPLGPYAMPDYLGEMVPVAPVLASVRQRLPDVTDDELTLQLGLAQRKGNVAVVVSSRHSLPGRERVPTNDAQFARAVLAPSGSFLDVGMHLHSPFSPRAVATSAAHEAITARPGSTADEVIAAVRKKLPGVSKVQVMHVLAGNGVGGLNNYDGYGKPWVGSHAGDGLWRFHPRDGDRRPDFHAADRAD